jgi:hypothetical protein
MVDPKEKKHAEGKADPDGARTDGEHEPEKLPKDEQERQEKEDDPKDEAEGREDQVAALLIGNGL